MNRRTFFSLAGAAVASPALAWGTDMQKQLKIVGLETDVLRFPPGQIYYDAIHEFGAARGAVVLRLQTNAGITGWATSSFGTMEGGPLVLQSILQNEVKQVLVGQDPAFPKRLRSDLWKSLEYSGVQGVAQMAIASAEIAVWDIKVAMEIAGKDRRVMVDANQKFDVSEAIHRGNVYQEMGCYWFEEPIVPYDHAGYAQVAEALDMRIATGENDYTKYAFADLIARRGVDVVQPDGRRAGGVSEWMEIGAIADAAKLPLASHGGGPEDMQMLLAMPNAIYMEGGSFKNHSSTIETLRMVDSAVLAPQNPGMGSELRPEYVQKHKV
jgi:L-alanine-DL-glutamate epimerase-like enolase superfamily enzyme